MVELVIVVFESTVEVVVVLILPHTVLGSTLNQNTIFYEPLQLFYSYGDDDDHMGH